MLHRSFNQSVKYIFNAKRSDHVTPLIRELSWLKLDSRRKLHTLILVHKILNLTCPSYLSSYFQPLSNVNEPPTRSNDRIMIPAHRTEICTTSFFVHGARLWNSLPNSNWRRQSHTSFKHFITKFYNYLHPYKMLCHLACFALIVFQFF